MPKKESQYDSSAGVREELARIAEALENIHIMLQECIFYLGDGAFAFRTKPIEPR